MLAAVKVLRPGFRFWPCFAALGLYGWVLFNAANVDARIADYNVDAYLGGRLPQVDIYYLGGLSPSALPALERLYEACLLYTSEPVRVFSSVDLPALV